MLLGFYVKLISLEMVFVTIYKGLPLNWDYNKGSQYLLLPEGGSTLWSIAFCITSSVRRHKMKSGAYKVESDTKKRRD